MKYQVTQRFFIIFALMPLVFVNGCICSKRDSGRGYSGSSYEYEEEVPPMENPYPDGSGRSAGYEWAQDNQVSSCSGASVTVWVCTRFG